MKAIDVVDKLVKRVPRADTWSFAKSEPYGPYFVKYDDEVNRVLYCVTPTNQVIQHFLEKKYDLLVSHHPFIKGPRIPQVILHTAMDCTVGGLNDQWRDILGIKEAKHFDDNLGWYGPVEPISLDNLRAKITAYLGTPPIGVTYSDKEMIESIVVCSGLGGAVEALAEESGADCYVMGEGVEPPLSSTFSSIVEIGHTLSEHKPGLSLIKSILEPDVAVHGAPIGLDRFHDEVYCETHKGII